MAGKVYVVTSGKGGVGKTTTTANLGVGLAKLGNKVALIDADIGLRNLDVVLGLENRIVYDIVDVVEDNCRLEQALIRDKRYSSLHLLPAAQTRDKTAISPDQMSQLCNQLQQEYDYIFVDSPAGIEQGFQNSISGADEAIVITTPEVSAVRDADRIIGMLESEGLSDPELVVNRIRMDMVQSGDMMEIEDMKDILAIKLLGIVPEDDQIVVSTNTGKPIVLSEGTKVGQTFWNIARRIEGEDVSYISLEATLVDRLKRFVGLN
ncbi:septum site-determining protein MinD [Halanaerobaculum tunisiense]